MSEEDAKTPGSVSSIKHHDGCGCVDPQLMPSWSEPERGTDPVFALGTSDKPKRAKRKPKTEK